MYSYPSQRFRASMTVSSSPEEATSALAGTHLFLRRVELRGCKLLSPGLIGNNALLYLLIISSNSENLPRSYDAIMKSVHHVKDVAAAKTHLTFLRLLVVKVSSMHFMKICTSSVYIFNNRFSLTNEIKFKAQTEII